MTVFGPESVASDIEDLHLRRVYEGNSIRTMVNAESVYGSGVADGSSQFRLPLGLRQYNVRSGDNVDDHYNSRPWYDLSQSFLIDDRTYWTNEK